MSVELDPLEDEEERRVRLVSSSRRVMTPEEVQARAAQEQAIAQLQQRVSEAQPVAALAPALPPRPAPTGQVGADWDRSRLRPGAPATFDSGAEYTAWLGDEDAFERPAAPAPPAQAQRMVPPPAQPGRALAAPPRERSMASALGDPSSALPPTVVPDRRAQILQAIQSKRGMKAPGQGEGELRRREREGPDYTGADVSDAVRLPFHVIANMLRGFSGRQGQQFRSDRVALDEQVREDRDRSREQGRQKQGDALTMRRQAMQEQELAARGEDRALARQDRAEDRSMRREQMTAQQRNMETRAALAERVAEARIASSRSEAERHQAMGDPRSGVSQAMQTAYRMRLAARPPAVRARMAQQLGVSEQELDAQVGRMSANQINALMPYLEADTRDLNTRHRGAGGGGGGGASVAPAARGTDDDPLVRDAIAAGVPAGTARLQASESPQSRRQLMQSVAAAGERAAGEGGEADMKLRAARQAMDEALAAIPPPGQDVPGFGPLDSLRGTIPFVQSPQGIRMRRLGDRVVRRYLRIESGGAITDDEVEAEMASRGMGAGASEESFREGMASLDRDLRARESARRRPGEQQTDTPPQRGGGGQRRSAAPTGQARYRLPNGRIVVGPAGRLSALPPGTQEVR